jgi:hypothetical protein
MKKIFTIITILLVIIACKKESDNYRSFGKEVTALNALEAESMTEKYETLKTNDSFDTKMIARVDEVCQMKGCWMKLNLEDGNQVMVRFKDYGFFMPKDIAGKEVIIEGKAFVKETSIEELRHYEEDAGKSAKEIALITAPKKTYAFEADGVLLKD